MSDWKRYCQGGKPVCTVYKYEELEDGMRDVCEKIGIPFGFDSRYMLKQSLGRKHYSEYYESDVAKNRIANAFYREIDLFKYSFKGKNDDEG